MQTSLQTQAFLGDKQRPAAQLAQRSLTRCAARRYEAEQYPRCGTLRRMPFACTLPDSFTSCGVCCDQSHD